MSLEQLRVSLSDTVEREGPLTLMQEEVKAAHPVSRQLSKSSLKLSTAGDFDIHIARVAYVKRTSLT